MKIEEYRKLNIREFILNYDLALTDYLHKNSKPGVLILLEPEETHEDFLPEINYRQIEINFLKELNRYRIKRLEVSLNYWEHAEEVRKYPKNFINENWYREHFNGNFKYHFLAKKLFSLDSSLKLERDFEELRQTGEETDYSNTKGTEKIIFLQQLGLLDHLRKQEPFNLSINAMAKAVSAFTGVPTTTAQSYLNPIYSPEADQSKNPLSKKKKVDAVKQILSKWGHKAS